MQPTWSYSDNSNTLVNSCSPQLGDLFEYGACVYPNKVAIADHRNNFSFSEIHELVHRYSVLLKNKFDIEAGQTVLVLTTKDCLVPVIAIALWRLGAVYAPVDSNSPVDRLLGIANNLHAKLIIDFSNNADMSAAGVAHLQFDSMLGQSKDYVKLKPLPSYSHKNDDVAYVIHTSGSTGVPKGVQISSQSLKQYFYAHNQVLQFNEQSRVFSLSPFHFDVSIEDTILPLSVGAFVYQYNRLHQGQIIRKTLIKQDVTHLIAVSTILTMMSEQHDAINRESFPNLKMVMTGAEVCAPNVINLWKKALPDTRVINAYGPTEVTIVSTCYTVERVEEHRESAYPIGKPLDGVAVLILDEKDQDVSLGTAGELCLGGAQVMQGYLNRAEENDRCLFTRNGIRFYRSGDICFMNSDGNIEFVGRNDSEVKLNGRRIHLGEIQQQCLSINGVARVAVGLINQDGKSRIGAVIVSDNNKIIDKVEKHLVTVLPVYMIPMVWGLSSSVSLSSSGKTNDAALLAKLSESQKIKNRKLHLLQEEAICE